MQPAASLLTCCKASSLRTTARFFEEGRSAVIVALRFKAFNLDREHRLDIGSLKGFECEAVGYKIACGATLATSWILYHSDGMSTWDVVVLEMPTGTVQVLAGRSTTIHVPWKESTEACIASRN